MKSKFFFTAGMVGVLSGVALWATDGAEADYGSDCGSYVTLRGGWLFGGKVKLNDHADGVGDWGAKKSIKSAWSGSVEFGRSLCDDRVFVGLELGYFTGKAKIEKHCNPTLRLPPVPAGVWSLMPGGGTIDITESFADGKMKNFFGACNVTLRYDVGECAFLYGGIGAGITQCRLSGCREASMLCTPVGGVAFAHREGRGFDESEWWFFSQAFAGLGVYLNESWQLTAGYRLRYVPIGFEWCGIGWSSKVEQDILHAAEIGLTYRF